MAVLPVASRDMGLFGSRPPSREKFAQQVLDAVRATGKIATATYDADDFAIVFQRDAGDNETGRIFLHNTFHETAELGRRERADRIRQLVSVFMEAQSRELPWAQAKNKLRPVLRGVSYGAGMLQSATVDSQVRMLSRPALPYLVELVVIDEPTSMAYVTSARLPEWGVSADEVFHTARANLAQGASGVTQRPGSSERAMVRFIDSGDSYFTSMLLLDGFLAGLAPRVGGRPIAFVPDKNTLMVIAGDRPETLPDLFGIIEQEFSESVRSISPVAYTVNDTGRVIPYQAPPGHPELARAVHRAEVLLAAGEYGGQKEALEAAHERSGVDIFVGSVLLAERPDRSLFSVAVWPPDVDTLLPEADYVAFPSEDDQVTVPFEDVAREASLLPEPDYQPARYRLTAWPGPAVMDRLRAQAVSP